MITGNLHLDGVPPTTMPVVADSDVGAARRLAARAAHAQGFGDADEGRVAIVATEMGTNLVKYADDGKISVRLVSCGARRGVELLATDRGPGMSDVRRRVEDGYSTGGTRGEGLGAIARLSDLFDIHSCPGQGTVAMARLWVGAAPPPPARAFLVGAVSDPIPGEQLSGDGWAVEQQGSRLVALVVDGLGHGPAAARAATVAIEAFRHHVREPAEAIVARLHEELRVTRGAALAVAEIDAGAGQVRYCGVGNIAGRVLGAAGPFGLMSHFGTAGHQVRRIQALEAPWDEQDLLLMHSDGVSTKWGLGADLRQHHPLLVAASVMRDANRGTDDATVLAVRASSENERETP